MNKKSKLTLSLLTGLLALTPQSIIANDRYFKLGLNSQSAQSQKILGVQEVSEIVGNGGNQIIAGYGLSFDKKEQFGGSLGFAYLTIPDEKEHILALDFDVHQNTDNYFGFIPYFGGTVGLGLQFKSGEKFNTSTSANKASFISGTTIMTPNVGTHNEDPVFLLIGFQVGTKYKFNDNFNAFLAYDYQAKYMQVDYSLATSSVRNNMTFTHRFNGVKLGVNYSF